jgi:hypothetical protein
MAYQTTRRHLVRGLWTLALGAVIAVALTAMPLGRPTPAAAAGPTSIAIDGPGLSKTLTVPAAEHPDQFAALLREVNWLYSRAGQSSAPAAGKLGAKFTVTVYVNKNATQRYDLYPLADGGPRAFRPASQPDRHKVDAGWFYARLTLPDTMRAAGVPIEGGPQNLLSGGIGGGEVTDAGVKSDNTVPGLFDEWRGFVLLNGAVVVVITLGLAGVALLVRRLERRRLRRIQR